MKTLPKALFPDPIPARAGIGLRAEHYSQILEQRPDVGFVEAHSENYFGQGGAPHQWLGRIREHYSLSLHGVGLSLGSVDPIDAVHLNHLKSLVQRYQPSLVSDHLSWCSVNGTYLNDLLPLPYTEEALAHISTRIEQVQNQLQETISIENVSSYLRFEHSTIPEWEFIVEVARRSGCRILLDVNNVYVNACNHGFDPLRYVDYIPGELVSEIHVAGHAVNRHKGRAILIDDHGSRVSDSVWSLYAVALNRFGPVATLIEWDTNIPDLDVLVQQAHHADQILENINV